MQAFNQGKNQCFVDLRTLDASVLEHTLEVAEDLCSEVGPEVSAADRSDREAIASGGMM